MLVLTRNVGQEILIGKDIRVKVLAKRGKRIQLGIYAPDEIEIVRGELQEKTEKPRE